MDSESKRMIELQQINANIEVYKKLLQSDMPEEGKEVLRNEITTLTYHIIPQLKCYDV